MTTMLKRDRLIEAAKAKFYQQRGRIVFLALFLVS